MKAITEFWERESCGQIYAVGDSLREQLRTQAETRYQLEPYICDFAKFQHGEDQDVLEVGVGMGADHLQWAQARPRRLVGVDLTERAVQFTRTRLSLEGHTADVRVANAEELPFAGNSFDIVYSWGVLHHSTHPQRAIDEVFRVLRPNGTARIMIYNKYSITGLLLWLRYGVFRKSLTRIYADHLESPGTHAYSVKEARKMFHEFGFVKIFRRLSVSDLLEGAAGQRHQGPALSLAKKLWPRWWLRHFKRFGLFMMIEASKPAYSRDIAHAMLEDAYQGRWLSKLRRLAGPPRI